MEKPALIGASLSDVKMIMTVMRVLMAKLLWQAVTGRVLVLECLLPGARGCLWLHHVLPSIKWTHFSRTLVLMVFAQCLGYPRA
jgi:hypothetical protein